MEENREIWLPRKKPHLYGISDISCAFKCFVREICCHVQYDHSLRICLIGASQKWCHKTETSVGSMVIKRTEGKRNFVDKKWTLHFLYMLCNDNGCETDFYFGVLGYLSIFSGACCLFYGVVHFVQFHFFTFSVRAVMYAIISA